MKGELVSKYTKYTKTIGNRVVEVEFSWYQVNPYQNYRLRLTEQQFLEAQKHIRSKKLLSIKFQQFVELIAPIFAIETAEISISTLRSTFDRLFDQNSNGKVEHDELQSLLILLQGLNTTKQNFLHENLRRNTHISFREFYDFVKCGYLRELLMS